MIKIAAFMMMALGLAMVLCGWVVWWPLSAIGFIPVLVASKILESKTGTESYDPSRHDRFVGRTEHGHQHSPKRGS